MNKKLQVHVKTVVKACRKIAPADWTIDDVISYVSHEWRVPMNLSILLSFNDDYLQQYITENTPWEGPDSLMVLENLKRCLTQYIEDKTPADMSEELKKFCAFDLEFTGGIAGCVLTNPANQGRVFRAIRKMLGLWDGVVADKIYPYILRRLNQAIADETLRRVNLNKVLPANLQLPTNR